MPHSINHGDACLAYFNKIWGIPREMLPWTQSQPFLRREALLSVAAQFDCSNSGVAGRARAFGMLL
jgi:hypothetical protein